MSHISSEEARRRLTQRWAAQVERFPTMREDTPLANYISENLRHVMRSGGLAKDASQEGEVPTCRCGEASCPCRCTVWVNATCACNC